jgi:hypothetical protein
LLYFWHSCLPAHEDDLLDVGGLQVGVLQGGLARRNRLLNEIVDKRLSLARVNLMLRCFARFGQP